MIATHIVHCVLSEHVNACIFSCSSLQLASCINSPEASAPVVLFLVWCLVAKGVGHQELLLALVASVRVRPAIMRAKKVGFTVLYCVNILLRT